MSFFHTDRTQLAEILLLLYDKNLLVYTVNIMGVDVLAKQGARASATMICLCWTGMIGPPQVKG